MYTFCWATLYNYVYLYIFILFILYLLLSSFTSSEISFYEFKSVFAKKYRIEILLFHVQLQTFSDFIRYKTIFEQPVGHYFIAHLKYVQTINFVYITRFSNQIEFIIIQSFLMRCSIHSMTSS